MAEAPGLDPLAVLVRWHEEATEMGAREPNAMTLATAKRDGRPSARVVLYKGLAGGRVQFVTHYESRKGREIEQNPEVALVFFWPELMRQVRVEGRASRAPAADSDAYFRTRPRESQLGVWASSQSEVVASRAAMMQRFAEAEARFAGREVERPAEWGLYQVDAHGVELWLSAPHRLHDRFSYTRKGATWEVARLYP